MILQLNVNKTNTKVVSTNKTTCYIFGIGMTNYTIHKDAYDISNIYSDNNYYHNYTILDKHNHHVFRARIRSIVDDIKWRQVILYKGKKYNVIDSYIGIENECRAKLDDKICSYRSLVFEGTDIKFVPKKIKYILNLSEI